MTAVFVFMLTRSDRTIADASERLEEALEAGVRHIGFKDVGLPISDLVKLTERIHAGGGRAYLEVVSLDEASEIASARSAVALGVDVLMGGTRPSAVLPIIAGSGIEYFPFPGQIVGHPSRLAGTVSDIVESAKVLAAVDGVDGLDLLAYRFAGDVEDLIAQVCAAVTKPLIVAGSIDRPERIQAAVSAGAWGFTVGTAALDGCFHPERTALRSQLAAITACAASSTASG
jgi:4-hydroxythreonine-4-phosphate dehydrogenase